MGTDLRCVAAERWGTGFRRTCQLTAVWQGGLTPLLVCLTQARGMVPHTASHGSQVPIFLAGQLDQGELLRKHSLLCLKPI